MGKGKSRVSIKTLDKEQRTAYAVKQAEIMYKAKPVMAEKIKENNQEFLFYNIEMPLIYVLRDMEKNGIKVDRNGLVEYGEKLSRQIDTITNEIFDMCGEEFNINSPKQLGYILFDKMGLKGGKRLKQATQLRLSFGKA